MARVYDAIVIGAGHNGLVTAAYLARAGWSGSGTHPGGGVTGAPGHKAAHEILRQAAAGRA